MKIPIRLGVSCGDQLGLTHELPDLLVLKGVGLCDIKIDPIGRIYLNFTELKFEGFGSLMAEIRRIVDVTDMHTVLWMLSEREHLTLDALLETLPEPILSVDIKNRADMAGSTSYRLFGQKLGRLRNHTTAQLISSSDLLH